MKQITEANTNVSNPCIDRLKIYVAVSPVRASTIRMGIGVAAAVMAIL
jgi:hypothetical protein